MTERTFNKFRSHLVTGLLELIVTHQLDELGRDYDIAGEIGRGGMAVVYRATVRSTGQAVALKLLRPYVLADPEALQRLDGEAGLVQRLVHPRIVQLLRLVPMPRFVTRRFVGDLCEIRARLFPLQLPALLRDRQRRAPSFENSFVF